MLYVLAFLILSIVSGWLTLKHRELAPLAAFLVSVYGFISNVLHLIEGT